MKKLIPLVALGALATACGSPDKIASINAGGATFPASIYQVWFNSYSDKVRVNYQSTGSGSGVRQYNAGTIDFGASDKALSDDKIKAPVVQIPMTGGAIVPAYNLPGCDAKFSQKELADVFLGNITNWNQVGCQDQVMTVVHRSDGSGTTAGFTSSLSSFSSEWKDKVCLLYTSPSPRDS